MIELLTAVALSMAAILVILVATIVIMRALSDRRRRIEGSLRPGLESAIADYLAGEAPAVPQLASGPRSRDLLQIVALELIAELHGRERQRVVELLEGAGIVADAIADLGSRRRRVRRTAAEMLRQVGSEQAVDALAAALSDPDLDTRLTCAAALAELSDGDLAPRLLEIADRSALERPGAVMAILVTLGRRHPASLAAALVPGASTELRHLAVAVIGELRLAQHVGALRDALESDDDELVARAARGLGFIGDDGALPELLELVEDETRSWFVRLAATGALGMIGDQRAVQPLEHELGSEVWLLQSKAAKALRMLGSPGSEALGRALASPTATVRDHAKVALRA